MASLLLSDSMTGFLLGSNYRCKDASWKMFLLVYSAELLCISAVLPCIVM